MGCCFSGTTSIDAARTACRDALFEAVTSQLIQQSELPTLIDAVPTIGKTSAAAQFAAELCEGEKESKLTYLTHRTSNREQFEEMVRGHVSDDSVVDVAHLPVLEKDCPTAKGDYGEAWQNRLLSLRDQGLSPSSLHRNNQLDLPCAGRTCPYMEWSTRDELSDILIGHLSHAYIPEVVENRIVIIDEDPEDAFQIRFSADELHQVTREFLSNLDQPPVTDLDSLKLLREGGTRFEEARKEVVELAQDIDRLQLGEQILESGQGHVGAADVVRALLEPEREDLETAGTYRTVLDNGVEHTRLGESTVAAYDPNSGELALRHTPEFSQAAALVALDGTPTEELWQGRLGIDGLNYTRVLCDECRQIYLEELLGYRLFQTTPYIKPYSGASAKRISFEKDRGLLHEVERRFDEQVGLITTKQVKNRLLEYEDGNEISIPSKRTNHYRNIKGSNEFAGDEVRVGVIIGSPHPGPDELRLLAGLNGDVFDTEVVEKTRDGHHYSRREPTEGAEPYLNHVREHSVAQAILRFGRQDGAIVFIHTSALPQWLQEISDEAHIRRRAEGEQSVIQVLQEVDEATTTEIADRIDFSDDTARKHLKNLVVEGLVSQDGDSHRIKWAAVDTIQDISLTVDINLDWDREIFERHSLNFQERSNGIE